MTGDAGTTELEAFTAESEALEATLATVADDDWALPGLGEWTLSELVAHVTRGTGLVATYGDQGTDATEPEADRVTYWHADLEAQAPRIAERARATAAGVDPRTWPVRFAEAWRASVEAYGRLGPDGLLASPRGVMRAREYLATRVLELCVHHMDVCTALDRPPVPTPEAGRITLEILEALLGERRPRNFGRARFILAGTGRIAVDDPRYPLLR